MQGPPPGAAAGGEVGAGADPGGAPGLAGHRRPAAQTQKGGRENQAGADTCYVIQGCQEIQANANAGIRSQEGLCNLHTTDADSLSVPFPFRAVWTC